MPRSPSRIVRARYRATRVLHGRAETQELPMQESLHRSHKRDGWPASSFEATTRQYGTVARMRVVVPRDGLQESRIIKGLARGGTLKLLPAFFSFPHHGVPPKRLTNKLYERLLL